MLDFMERYWLLYLWTFIARIFGAYPNSFITNMKIIWMPSFLGHEAILSIKGPANIFIRCG